MELIAKFIHEDQEAEFIRFNQGGLMITIMDGSGSHHIVLEENEIQELRHYLNLTDNVGMD